MNKNVFQPIGDKLICLPVEQEQMSSGGIYLPDVDDKKFFKSYSSSSRSRVLGRS